MMNPPTARRINAAAMRELAGSGRGSAFFLALALVELHDGQTSHLFLPAAGGADDDGQIQVSCVMHDGAPVTAILSGLFYATHGVYKAPRVGDEVLLAFPNGNAEETPWLIASAGGGEMPPEFLDGGQPREDMLAVLSEGDINIVVTGSGTITIRNRSGTAIVNVSDGDVESRADTVRLGRDPIVAPVLPNEGVVVGTGIDTFTGTAYSVIGNSSTVVYAKK